MDNRDKTRGRHLRELRQQHDWTQQQVGDKLGVTGSAIRQHEAGGGISRSHAIGYALMYQVPVSDIDGSSPITEGDQDAIDRAIAAGHDEFLRRAFGELGKRVTTLEVEVAAIRQLVVEEAAAIRGLLEEQAAALLPLVTATLANAADRRSTEEDPPGRAERRASPGRRGSDPGS